MNTAKYSLSLLEMFEKTPKMFEDSDYDDVIYKIRNNFWDDDAQDFLDSILKSKHPEMLTVYSLEDLNKMILFKVPGFDIGYALSKFQKFGFTNIVSVHNNSNVSGIGKEIMASAIREGGKYLDHFDVPTLTNLYSAMGFVEYYRKPFDPKYDELGFFRKKYGEADVVYRKLKNAKMPNIKLLDE